MSIKSRLADICCKVYEKGFVAGYSGNFSVRASNNSMHITPSAKCKSETLFSYVTSSNILLLENNSVSLYSVSKKNI